MQPATTTTPTTTPTPTPPPPAKSRRTIIWIALIALAFGLGYGPKEYERRKLESKFEQTELDLRLANLHRQLGLAMFEAQRDNFGNAATAARTFFEGCRSVANGYEFKGQPRTQLALQSYGSQSDVILGQLANADPTVKERLASLFLTMNGVLERRL